MGTLWHAPVLVSAHSLRPANDSEALARAFPNGEETIPSETIAEDQRFVDARLPDPEAPEDAVSAIPEDEEVNPADIPIPTVFSKTMIRLVRTRNQLAL